MIRILTLLVLLAAPVSADTSKDTAFLRNAIPLLTERNARLSEVIAPQGIATSQMTADGTVPVTFADGTGRDVRLGFVGALADNTCTWGTDFEPLDQLDRTISETTQAFLIAEGLSEPLTQTTNVLSAEECRVRGALAALTDPCLTVFPLSLTETIELHLSISLPEICE